MTKRRVDMKPGEMFRYERRVEWRGYSVTSGDVMVVIDRDHEVGFWQGGEWCIGRQMPSLEFEVVS